MKKYKIIKEHRPLTDKEMETFKSFSGLTEQYQRATKRPTQPLYKNKWAFIALVIIILLLLMIMDEI